jgi:prephenate dehydrogenase/chorismate mutase/prephenate dehydrogenase
MGSAHPTRNAFYFIAGVIVTSCAAAIATQSSPPATVSSRRVTVIGGRGTMGSFFTQYLSAAGHHVMILEQEDWDDADKLLARAELVLVCVPIQCTLDVICKAARYLAPTTALADMTSIKTPVIQTMLEQHRGPVMGLHPMFGPGVQSFLSQKVIVCPGRGDSAFQWLLDFIESEGGRLIVCTPEEHDQMMIAVQAIRHFSTFGLGVFLAEEGIDICRSLNFASPSYRLELGLITRLFAQHAPLCIDIMLATEERCRAIERLADTYNRLANLIMQKDRDTLIHEFAVARSTFGEELSCSLEASTHVINAFSTCLAANKVEQEHSAIARTRSTKISSLSHSYDAQVKPKEPAQL